MVSGGGVQGFDFFLLYDPAVIKITGVDNQRLVTSGGGAVPLDFSDIVPDTDGSCLVAFADFGANIEDGPGVLSRISIEAVGMGTSPLVLAARPFTVIVRDVVIVLDGGRPARE